MPCKKTSYFNSLLLFNVFKVIKSGWIDWSGKDISNSLNLKNLEELFGQDSEAKPKTPGIAMYTFCQQVNHLVVYPYSCSSY